METFISFDGTLSLKESRVPASDAVYKGPRVPIARGAGLSYSPVSSSAEGVIVDYSHRDRLIAYDEESQELLVEAGAALGQVLELLVSKGRWFPVLPGYPKVSVGGSIGCNVHGKSQYHEGLFSDWVSGIELFHPSMGVAHCSPSESSHIFDLTMGGFGLTGHIRKVHLKTCALKGALIKQRRLPVRDFFEAKDALMENCDRSDSLYSWHQFSPLTGSPGSGYIFCESWIGNPLGVTYAYPEKANFNRDNWISFLQGGLAWALSPGFSLLQQFNASSSVKELKDVAFPIIGKEIYFDILRRRGFREYQVIIPFEKWEHFVQGLLRLKKSYRLLPATLCSLKIFRGSRKYLSFVQDGVCFSIDIPNWRASVDFLKELEAMAVSLDGLPSLYKDSRFDPAAIRIAYGTELQRFQKDLLAFEGSNRVNSWLRERLGF